MKDSVTIKIEQNYKTEEFFEKVKDYNFTAGKPEYKDAGVFSHIKLPAVGRYCIKITAGNHRVFLIISEDMAQVDKVVTNSMIRGKLGVFAKALDNDKKPSQELLEKTAAELKEFLGI